MIKMFLKIQEMILQFDTAIDPTLVECLRSIVYK